MKYAFLLILCVATFAASIDDIKGRSTRELGGWSHDWDDKDEGRNLTIGVQPTNTSTNTTGVGNCSCNCTCDCFSCNCSCNCTTPLNNQTVTPPSNQTNCTCPRRHHHKRCHKSYDCDDHDDYDDYWISEGLEEKAGFLEYEDFGGHQGRT
ncbi:unnamed protein product [Blepharisma stoltei]|uniref:Uncharacterized protein n=1 Tax=Blepharisma stoltei TaxID=1481888 RepID=A0AAU9JA85_9CILI|nr:unnamed protein product [Blepharisma stoltei]